MIKIVPDKEGKLTQWDLNRKVIVTGYEGAAEVHFASPGDDHGAYVVKLVDGEAEIPNILLTMAGTINVYVYPADRTVFATALWVMAREKPDDYVYTETEVLSYKTLDEKIGDLAKLTTTAKENLVAAINEAATKGMASIYMRVAEGYIEYSGDGVNWKQLIAVAELKGEKGEKGDTGAQGVPGAQGEKGDKGDKGDPGSDATVDIVTPTAESTDTQAASAKAVWDMIGTGGSGTDISLGVTGAAVGDIIKVKAVDANGKPTAWEAATAKLANPNALTFTGAVTGSYDGSAPLSVEIPSGGGGRTLELIADVTTAEETTMISITQDSNGNPLSIKSWAAYIYIPAHQRDTAKSFYARGTSYGGGMTFTNMLITSNKEIGFFLYPIADYDAQDALDIDHPLKAQYISSFGGNTKETAVGFRINMSIFQVYTDNAEVLFPAGVRVRLWGVRT